MTSGYSRSLISSEPANILQRPSSAKSQDVSHLLAKHFGEAFIRDAVDPQTVNNLRVSAGSDDTYNESYVTRLLKISDERQKRMEYCTALERSIMQAKARAMSADERRFTTNVGSEQITELGLPVTESHFRDLVDNEYLRSNGLICPADLTRFDPFADTTTATVSPTTGTAVVGNSSPETRLATEMPGGRYTAVQSAGSRHTTQPAGRHSAGAARTATTRKTALWRNMPTETEREIDRRELQQLQDKVAFRHNPRHLLPHEKGAAGVLVRKTVVEGDCPIFIASPQTVRFTHYEIGESYEVILDIKNVTAAMRTVSIIPPRTEHFSVSLGQFPAENGLIAPGLSCRYAVRFIPDTLGDFEDHILVHTQDKTPLTVRIVAHRPAPVLNLPEILDVGHSLIFESKLMQFSLVNTGGKGSFIVMPKSKWPETNIRSLKGVDKVQTSAFEISPSYFTLNANDSLLLNVLFWPFAIKQFRHDFVIVCDNLQVQYFSIVGEGEMAAVTISDDKASLSTSEPGEQVDVSAEAMVRYSDVYPYSYDQKRVELKNLTHLSLPFSWQAVKPLCATSGDANSETLTKRVLDVNCPFSVDPSEDILKPNETREFCFTFAPTAIGNYHSVLHMILHDVPDIFSNNQIDIASFETTTISETFAKGGFAIRSTDVTEMQIELKGACEEYDLALEPAAVLIPGKILINNTVRQKIKICNNSSVPAAFKWPSVSKDYCIIEVEPSLGIIGAKQFGYVEVCVTMIEPCSINEEVACTIEHSDLNILLRVSAHAKGPSVVIDRPDVNFGLLRLGTTAVESVVLTNSTQISCDWRLAIDDDLAKKFTVIPSSGTLKPMENSEVSIHFNATEISNIREIFEFSTHNGESSFLNVSVLVQQPIVRLVECQLVIPDLYVDVEMQFTIRLDNQTKLSSFYSWHQPLGDGASDCGIRFAKVDGEIPGRTEVPIEIYIAGKQICNLRDCVVPCHIEGMGEPLYLSIEGEVKGLSVDYSIIPSDSIAVCPEDPLQLDFGDAVGLDSIVVRHLKITNTTAIPAEYWVGPEFFFSTYSDDNDKSSPNYVDPRYNTLFRTRYLNKTANLADPKSKPPKQAEYDRRKSFLGNKRGAAFHCNPASGNLGSFAQQMIEITAYNDMWGAYHDQLICQVANLQPKLIPMKMNVVGNPIEFTMTAGLPNQIPVVRFGTCVVGTKPLVRPIRLNNKSPFPIRIDWEVFNQVPDDEKVLDCVFSYGRAYPPLDEDHNEVLPPLTDDDADRIPPRPATNVLPDSPDTELAITPKFTTPTDDNKSHNAEALLTEVVSLHIRPHEGIEKYQPFTVNPKQLTLQGESYENITVTFTPIYDDDNVNHAEGSNCNSYAVGYLSLLDQDAWMLDRVDRSDGFGAEQLRLNMTSRIESPSMEIDYFDDENGYYFYTVCSDILRNDGSVAPVAVKQCSAVLRNLQQTPLKFSLTVEQPFFIISPAALDQYQQSSKPITLDQYKSINVDLGFLLTHSPIERINNNPPPLTENSSEWLSITSNGERILHYRDSMIVQYENGYRETIPLHAQVRFPALQLSKNDIDFGTCFVGQEREQNVSVINVSQSMSCWRLAFTRGDTSAFRITPDSGQLEGCFDQLAKNNTYLRVFFTPAAVEAYECEVTFEGILGEEPRVLKIVGVGSLDGQYQEVYNI